MKKICLFDRIVSEKAYKKCVDEGYKKYSDIAILLGTSDSFAKAVFSVYRKKLNIYHLMRLSYELNCTIDSFLPNLEDYKNKYTTDDEYVCFLKSIEEDNL